MSAYSSFAYVYDILMRDVNYEGWIDYIEQIFNRYGLKPRNIVELACGTGNIANRLAKRDYNVIGTDLSEDMLMVAQEKAADLEVPVIYLHQDMKEMMLPNELDCILCVCDGMNYILKESDLKQIFQSVYEHLKDGGLFIFDISSHYKLSHILGRNTFAENHKGVSYIWENYYDEKRGVCDFDLTLFVQEEKLYRKHTESHSQRAYREEEITSMLDKIPFKKMDFFDAFTFQKPNLESERIYFICQK
ncbi:ubiquinone/menaquinone biosynthesis C-methylase UbiE [Anaerosolibacter carboniphilus]|uniref:Ubiquinone/menaquinone biosynthesis C-methylase UbiE n=1 Tax=Anaerosolibacter carboniphilus TaxID=1417629 RepID=A0A841KY38_9FIRM|nr:class I SAM-dependent methyltransferase [Anaerosolibacter carboniphilus]MBB6218267.1 ubiquinone/menaquinone biosynthesis C-methylase UbiE [Anaerosolibacter carboniphilus]